jgi:hypothetical protein
MELTIVHADVRDLIQNMTDDAPDKQARIFLPLVQRLQAAGAEAAAVERLSSLRVINTIPEIEAATRQAQTEACRCPGNAGRDEFPPLRRHRGSRGRRATGCQLRDDA